MDIWRFFSGHNVWDVFNLSLLLLLVLRSARLFMINKVTCSSPALVTMVKTVAVEQWQQAADSVAKR